MVGVCVTSRVEKSNAGEPSSFQSRRISALAHPTRITIVELLRRERGAGKPDLRTAYLEQANASQHLAVLRSKQIVAWRKDGNQVFYSLRDPRLGKILDLMRQYFQAHLHEALAMLRDMETDENPK